VDLSLVVPAYNEAARIRRTLESLRSWLAARGPDWEIVVAAEGDDGTRDIAAGLGAGDPRLVVLGGTERGGKGRAIRLGVARSRGRVVGFVDGDGKTPVEDLDRLLPWLERGFEVVIGSRAVADARIEVPPPVYRRLGSRAFALAVRALLGLRDVRDTQCGFKVFRGDVARELFARQRIDGYMFDVEVLRLAQRSGYRIKEVGVRWRDDRDSRLDLVAGNWRNLVDLARIHLGRPPGPSPGVSALASGDKP
jgi:glycosyltransferase involved in cell wall biosynthesis